MDTPEVCFQQALSNFNANIAERIAASTNRLHACLAALSNLLVPEDERDENYAERDEKIEALTFDQLAAEIRSLGGHA